jgi:pimeloyl-ACP methyl ester carboxylesterase
LNSSILPVIKIQLNIKRSDKVKLFQVTFMRRIRSLISEIWSRILLILTRLFKPVGQQAQSKHSSGGVPVPKNLYALLIGIDDYPPPVPRLYGCVNDITAFETYLQGRVASGEFKLHLRKLTDSQASRQAVIDGFRQHLRQAGPEDVALLYYTGHGSQEPAPEEFWAIEPDRMNETLVCWDSRAPDGLDLADKEIALLIDEVQEKGAHFVIIMDCCHSGSGTRDALQFNSIRQAPADHRQRTIDTYLFPKERMMQARAQAEASKGKSSGWQTLPHGRHVLLAACQDIQTAKEHYAEGKSWGAFSFFLRDALQSANAPLTYRDLFKQAQARVRASVRDQAPQLEAARPDDLELPFLGGAIQPRPAYFTASFNGAEWILDGGTIHGIPAPVGVETTHLALFPLDATAESISDLSQAKGQAQVVEVRPDSSVIDITGFAPDPGRTYKAVVTALPMPPVGVRLEGDEAGLKLVRDAITGAAPVGPASLYVEENETSPRLRVLAQNNEYILTRAGDEKPVTSILQGFSDQNASQVKQRLEHIARWLRTSELENPATALPPDAVTLSILRDGQEVPEDDPVLAYTQQAGQWVRPSISVYLRNNSDQVLFCTVLALEENFSAVVMLRQQPVVRLEPGQEFTSPALTFSISDELWKQGITDRKSIVKAIACTAEFDAMLLQQGKLDEPRRVQRSLQATRNTLNRLMNHLQTRDFDVEEPPVFTDWTTQQFVMTTHRPLDTQPISAQGEAVVLGPGVSLEPHPALGGRARLGSQSPATRDLGDPSVPAIFQTSIAEYPAFAFRLTRSAGPAENTLELHQVADHRAVTAEAPLRINMQAPLAPSEHLLAYGYDGEFFLPLGAARSEGRQTQVELQRLPPPTSLGVRDLGGAIKIFFQKVISKPLGLAFPYPILAAVNLSSGEQPIYQADPTQVQARVQTAHNITLYVHGFIGDTRGMATSARTTNNDDLILAFDYESINTPIPEIARQLKERLQAVGLGPGHGKRLRLVVHSMGGVIARWLIEKEGGNAMVQHLVIVGSPSAGVPWASVQQVATVGLTLALNSLAPIAWPAKALAAFLAAFEKIDVTLDQLQPGSEVFQALAAAPDPGIPYTLIAGNTREIPKTSLLDEGKVSRLMKTLGYDAFSLGFFRQPNDIAIAVSSVFAIPERRAPTPLPVTIACDHVSFFTDPVGLNALKQALA